MTWVVTAVVGTSLVNGYIQGDASRRASNAQKDASRAGIAESRFQFDALQKLLAPYAAAGEGSLQAQQDLIGLGGQQAQQEAITGIEQGSQFQGLQQQGENAILQNASATGGLRGGNTQGALAQFRPQLLNQLIQQQYQNLGGITALGQNAAAGTGNAGIQTGQNIGNLLQQQGAAQAGGILGQANAQTGIINNSLQGFGAYAGITGNNPFTGAKL